MNSDNSPTESVEPVTGLRKWLPSRGNVLFTLLVVGILSAVQGAGAMPGREPAAPLASTNTIAYQGRLANADGAPLEGSYSMTFRLYGLASGGSALWTEARTSPNVVQVIDGLFSVLLGSVTPLTPSVIANNSSLWLGVTVGSDDEMTPRVQLGSAPFAMQAQGLPTGGVTSSMLADGAVTQNKLAPEVVIPQANIVSNVQSAYVEGPTKFASATAHIDLLAMTVTVTSPTTLRISYHSLVYKMNDPGRTMIGIRINGTPNTFPVDNGSSLQIGTPVTSDWTALSSHLSGTHYEDVSAGTHVVALVLGSYEAGVSYARIFRLSVERLRQP